jgi:transcriptional regulator with XRE-family HTH domain
MLQKVVSMKGVKVKYINPEILKELASLKPDAYNRMRGKYPKSEKWLSGEDYPTYNQLIELSKIFNVPFGYFFFKELPKYEMPIPHYRTIEKNHFKPSEELLDTIKFAQRVQDWAKDILLELGNDKIDFCGKYKSNLDLNAIVDELKAIFDVKEGWVESKITWRDAFRYLVDKAEEKGIIVLINGVVGNNTHRKLNVNEFRGFVLYDEIAPVVFINNNDTLSGKIFTLIHAVVHILIGENTPDNEIEKFCDKCAAEFLDNFVKFLQETQEKECNQPNFYETVKLRLSKRFLSLLKSAIYENLITYKDALLITDLKAKTFFKLIGKNA